MGTVFLLSRVYRYNYNICTITEDRALLGSNPSAVMVSIRYWAVFNDAAHIHLCRLAKKRKTPAAKRLIKKVLALRFKLKCAQFGKMGFNRHRFYQVINHETYNSNTVLQ